MKSRRSERGPSAHTVLALCLLLITGTARAQEPLAPSDPSATETEPPPSAPALAPADEAQVVEAREAFREASALARRSMWAEALAAFERSYELRPHPVTSYNIGYCERAMGRYARSYWALSRALAEHTAAEHGTLSDALRASTLTYREAAQRRLARVQVRVAPEDALLLVDGRPLQTLDSEPVLTALAGTRDPGDAERVPSAAFELWLDPGTHVFVLSAENAPKTVLTRRFTASERATLELRVQAPAHAPRPLPRSDDAPRALHPAWAVSSLVVGAAGVIVGTATGVAALRQRSELDDACAPSRSSCPSSRRDDIAAMNRLADVSTVSFIVGGVGLAAGGALLWLGAGRGADRERDRGAARGPVLGVGPGALRLSGRF